MTQFEKHVFRTKKVLSGYDSYGMSAPIHANHHNNLYIFNTCFLNTTNNDIVCTRLKTNELFCSSTKLSERFNLVDECFFLSLISIKYKPR